MTPGTLVAGKYRVERVLGRGGMGVVVEVTHLALGTRVALKFLDATLASDPTALARFQREARASALLKSEHVCRVSDFGVDNQIPFIVMELLTGTDLARLCAVRSLNVPTAALYIQQACEGLAEAHGAGIIHRDLKPGNLFLTRRADGRPLIKVLDFGVAKAPEGPDDVDLTGSTNVVGSQGFMSPEQFRSSKTVDGRSDVWSLGVILFKLVTGKLPFNGDSFAEFALAISREPTPPMPEAPAPFVAVVARCLEKDPANRYPDVKTLAEALAPFAIHAHGSGHQQIKADDPHAAMYLDALARPTQAPAAPAPPARATPVLKTLLGTPAPEEAPRPAPEVPIVARATIAGTAFGTAPAPHGIVGELAPGTVVGEYTLEKKIGEGGMGAVYSAVHPLIGKKAAIKVISAELGTDPVVVQRFVQEARSVNQIGHPNIVDVFAFGRLPDGRNYFVMELLRGESLRERLTRAFIPLSEGVQILDEIAGALEAAHEKQVVHRDLKPDNVFLSAVRGSYILVKLLDFGIAKLAEGDGVGIAKTSTGMMMGTPGYISPEQARGKNVDHRTDIYALGCMVFEVVTGRMPFRAESPMEIVIMHLTAAPPRASELVPDLPPALDQLILQMMDKEPDRRPSLSEVRDVFAELVASGMVLIEAGTGVTFRSNLSRARSESRTPPTGRRRQHAPSESPTMLAGVGPSPLPPAAPAVPDVTISTTPRTSRRGLVIAIVLLAVILPGVAIAVMSLGTGGNDDSSSASTPTTGAPAVALATPPDAPPAPRPDAAVPIDAASSEATPTDHAPTEAVPVTREVKIGVNVPTAKIVIDGVAVTAVEGAATVTLTDGPHEVSATAAGRIPLAKRVDVAAGTTTLELVLERAKANAKPTGTKAVKPRPAPGDANYTIDPFK